MKILGELFYGRRVAENSVIYCLGDPLKKITSGNLRNSFYFALEN